MILTNLDTSLCLEQFCTTSFTVILSNFKSSSSCGILSFDIVVEVCAVLKLDNSYVGQTSWKALGTECWKEQFHIELDKVLVILFH